MINKINNNLQDVFLNQARKGHIPVTIHLTNGFQLKGGFVKGFDNFTIILEIDSRQILVYKHAVSTISPQKPVLFTNNTENTSAETAEKEETEQ